MITEDHYIPEPNSGCWLWLGFDNGGGYGRLWKKINGKRTLVSAHREMWEQTFGKIPHGMIVCHKCDVKPCINPSHLFVGTYADNMRDMIQKNRRAKAKPKPSPPPKIKGRVKDSLRRVRTDLHSAALQLLVLEHIKIYKK